jgi:hypothetical protein
MTTRDASSRNTSHSSPRVGNADGRVHLSLSQVGGKYRLELFADAGATRRVAWGESSTPTGALRLVDDSGSGLSGHALIAFVAPATGMALYLFPLVLAWRLAHTRKLWRARDLPPTPFVGAALGDALPIIDPDVIGPDDFREPYPDRGKSSLIQRTSSGSSALRGETVAVSPRLSLRSAPAVPASFPAEITLYL